MLLVVTYSRAARTSLRNACRDEESVVRTFGRAALFEASEHGAFLACRLREKHPDYVQVERTEPFNEFSDAPDRVREAAHAFEARESSATPYRSFAAGSDHPSAEAMRERDLER